MKTAVHGSYDNRCLSTSSGGDISLEKIFSNINNGYKAYLMGLFYHKASKEDDTDYIVFDVFYVDNEYLPMFRPSSGGDPQLKFYTFNVDTNTCKSLCSSFNFSKFEVFIPEEYRVDFIRGSLEKSLLLRQYGSSDVLSIDISRLPGSLEMIRYLGVPFIYNGDDSLIQFTYNNSMDFFGILYTLSNNLLLDKTLHKYLSDKLFGGIKTCKVFKTHDGGVIPSKPHMSDVGYDVTVVSKKKDLTSTTALYDTGIKITPPDGYYVEIVPRSSLSKSGYILANSVGIIDPTYSGNLLVALCKVDPYADDISLPFRCCQIIFRKQYHVNIEECITPIDATMRGGGGFGSSG